MLTEVKNHIKVMLLSVKYNIMKEMTNPVTFITKIVFMILNNSCFIVQWLILFSLKDNVGGYGFKDVMLLWGLSASTYGLARIFFASAFDLPTLITNGKLDSYLVQPKNVLLSVITSSTKISAIGDVIYGYIVLLLCTRGIYEILIFTIFSITGAIITTCVAIIFGSMSFFFTRNELLADSVNDMMIHFSTYPENIFNGFVKILFYTILPIAIVAYLPIEVILAFNLSTFLIIIGFTCLMIFLSFIIFNTGLKRYTSSNLMMSKI